MVEESDQGKLFVVATPIGNLDDLSPRAKQALSEAEGWLVEDTRVSGKLATHLGLKKPMRLLTDVTPESAVEKYAKELESGKKFAVLTDGGAPCISDPGSRLVDLSAQTGVCIEVIPGPSAVITALMASGFYGQRFVFLGFLGRKPGSIRSELAPFLDSPLTLVLFESILRMETLLNTALEALGERRYALCRELTKSHEQIYYGKLGEIPSENEFMRKGELTIVIEGRRSASRQADRPPMRSSSRTQRKHSPAKKR